MKYQNFHIILATARQLDSSTARQLDSSTARQLDSSTARQLQFGENNANVNENLIIQGDNLAALKSLLPFYAGQVKCIYIDPPYNTGNAFEHYDDNLENSIWLSMIYPRLELLEQFLRPDGFIAVQIDDKQYARLYIMMCELFREQNLKTICVKMSEATGVKMASVNKTKSIAKLKEYIILAGKSGIKNLELERIPKEKWDNEYKTICLNVKKEELDFVKNALDNEERTEEELKILSEIVSSMSFVSLNEYSKQNNIKITDDWKFNNAWRIVQFVTLTGGARDLAVDKKMSYAADKLPNFFPVVTPRKKAYLINSSFNHKTELPRCKVLFADQYLTVHLGDFWSDIKTTGLDNEGSVDFPKGKKPEKLIERIFTACTKENDLVLDSFLGSGTTAAVAHKMNRRYIGIEIGEHAKTHVVPRLKKVIDGEQGGISKLVNWQGGGAFRFCELGETIFDEFGTINSDIDFEALAAHIWYLENRFPWQKNVEKSPLVGIHNGKVYYLLYNGVLGDRTVNGGNVLTSKMLKNLPHFDELLAQGLDMVIYGEGCRLMASRLAEKRITFKHIPHDVSAQ